MLYNFIILTCTPHALFYGKSSFVLYKAMNNYSKYCVLQVRILCSKAGKRFILLLVLLMTFIFCLQPWGYANAASINYTGDASELQNKPSWFSYPSSNLLFPGTTLATEGSNNDITVNITTGTAPSAVIGGLSQTGDAKNNLVTIKKGTVESRLIGGYVDAGAGSANNNQVIVEAGTIKSSISGGEVDSGTGDAKGNSVTINAGVTVRYGITGGNTVNGVASNNTVTITGATLGQNVWGGLSQTGVADSNKVTITDSTVEYDVIGGGSTENNAMNNEVVIINSTIKSGAGISLMGGYSDKGKVIENSVSLSGTTVAKEVFGGRTETGSVTGNKVFISDTVSVQSLGGGLITQGVGDARGNEVTMTGGTVDRNIDGGKVAKLDSDLITPTGSAIDNKLNISGGTVTLAAFGGSSSLGNTINNQVVISGTGKLLHNLFGGYSAAGGGYSTENTVTIKGGEVVGSTYGGRSDSSYASKNKVVVEGGKVSNIYGAYAPNSTVSNNSVEIKGGTVTGSVYGGFSNTGLSTGNTVSMSGGTAAALTGAYSASGKADSNSVNVSKGVVTSSIYGGLSGTGATADKNIVLIGSEATVGHIYGGNNGLGTANDNIVSIDGGTVNGTIYGGFGKASASGNIIVASGGNLRAMYGGFSSTGNAQNNHIFIDGGTVTGNVIAGYAQNGGKATNNSITIAGEANLAAAVLAGGFKGAGAGDIFTGNTLNVDGFKGDVGRFLYFENINFLFSSPLNNGDTVLNVLSNQQTDISYSTINLVFPDNPIAFQVGNSATLIDASAGTLVGDINEQRSSGTSAEQGIWTYNLATANNKLDLFVNKLEINNFNTTEPYFLTAGEELGQWVELQVNNNFTGTDFTISSAGQSASLTVGGSMSVDNFTATQGVGALNINVGTLDVSTRNTNLILNGTTAWNGSTGVLFDTIALAGGNTLTLSGDGAFGFNHLRVEGKDNVWDGNLDASGKKVSFFLNSGVCDNSTLLTVTGASPTNIDQSDIIVDFTGAAPALVAGNKITFIKTTNANLQGIPKSFKGTHGISLLYDFYFSQEDAQLYAVVQGVETNPQTKSLSEGRATGMAMVNQGLSLLAEEGVAAAIRATKVQDNTSAEYHLVGFGTMSASSSRYHTGSYVDINGFSLVMGLALRTPVFGDSLLLGAFFETGTASYNSYNSFSNASTVKGDGTTAYNGAGILVHYEFLESSLQGLYLEGSLRMGQVKTEFNSSDMKNSLGQKAHYESASAYYGAHFGLGYVWKIDEQASLDIATKYLWTLQEGDSVDVLGDKITFSPINSHRWRNELRFSYAINEQFKPYIGAAHEYEFDGEAKASTYGRNITAPTLKGSTAIAELGFNFKPWAESDFSLDFGIQAYTGMREGISGTLNFKYEF